MKKCLFILMLIVLLQPAKVIKAEPHMDTATAFTAGTVFVPIPCLTQRSRLTEAWNMLTRSILMQSTEETAPAAQFHFEQTLLETLSDCENTVVSPLSLSMAMTMAANGTTGETQREILHVLGIADLPAQNEQMQTILQTKAQTITIANAMWINQGYYPNFPVDFSPAFKDKIKAYFDGTAQAIPEKNGADTVNQWIAEHTNGKITHALKQSDWEDFLSVIVNTLTFQDTWAVPFDARFTAKAPFYATGGETEKEFMAQMAHLPYFEDELCQAVALPYKHGDISLILILPQSQKTPDLQAVIDGLQTKHVFVTMPKFEIKSQSDTTELLKTLGIQKAFQDDNPDFSEMYVNLPLTAKIKKVLHSAYIKTDENGTEAAAATIVGGAGGSAATEPPIQFAANRPFYFVLYDKSLEKVLMMGRYVQ